MKLPGMIATSTSHAACQDTHTYSIAESEGNHENFLSFRGLGVYLWHPDDGGVMRLRFRTPTKWGKIPPDALMIPGNALSGVQSHTREGSKEDRHYSEMSVRADNVPNSGESAVIFFSRRLTRRNTSTPRLLMAYRGIFLCASILPAGHNLGGTADYRSQLRHEITTVVDYLWWCQRRPKTSDNPSLQFLTTKNYASHHCSCYCWVRRICGCPCHFPGALDQWCRPG